MPSVAVGTPSPNLIAPPCAARPPPRPGEPSSGVGNFTTPRRVAPEALAVRPGVIRLKPRTGTADSSGVPLYDQFLPAPPDPLDCTRERVDPNTVAVYLYIAATTLVRNGPTLTEVLLGPLYDLGPGSFN